jgi:hypothetical protein
VLTGPSSGSAGLVKHKSAFETSKNRVNIVSAIKTILVPLLYNIFNSPKKVLLYIARATFARIQILSVTNYNNLLSCFLLVCRYNDDDRDPDGQTVHPGQARPVSGELGRSLLTGRFLRIPDCVSSITSF